ncbi:MAG: hypothetical protein BMS9Abin17_0984 [Acidimicrobiia bacterium]|nr:MAG: hypothetical protein BMS9Abin17_0984 [Acidimicrobiia bacterium]
MATLIVVSTPRDGEDEALMSYVEQVVPMILNAGGVPVKRLRVTDVVHGSPDAGFVFVADFKDASTVRQLFASAEYKALIPVRDQGFAAMDIFITEDN